ncbi:MAG: AAA family ATPase [Bacilli bacterium]
MNKRETYLDKLMSFKDANIIKVITGFYGCGKSTLLLLYKDYLVESGIKKSNIILINFESIKYKNIKNYEELYDYIAI